MPVFKLDIVTPERTIYSGSVQSLRAPGSQGGFGVLPRHASMLAALAVGPLSFVEEEGEGKNMAISGGFAEVRGDSVTVLAETAESPVDIDVNRAQAARDRALERLSKRADIDVERAQAALMRALNRLTVGG